MSKITLSSLSNLQNETTAVGVINNNSAVITTAFDNTLSRDGTSPNQMGANLDMNSNQILNLPAPATVNSPARLIDVVSNPTITVPSIGTSGAFVGLLNGNNTYSGTSTFTNTVTLPANTVTNSNLATMAANTIKANATGGVASPTNVTLGTSLSLGSGSLNLANILPSDVYFKSGKPWYDVIAFGADPTGVADSTSAIQSAISASSASFVYLPQGVYKVSSTLTISTTGISLVGAGRLTSQIKTTQTTGDIISITAPYTKIESLTIVGPGNAVMTSGNAINDTGGYGSSFKNLYISDVFNGITLTNASNCLVQYVKMANIYGAYGVQFSGGGGHSFRDNQLDPLQYGGGSGWTNTSTFGAWTTTHAYAANSVVTANGGYFYTVAGGTSAGAGGGPVTNVFNTPITDGTITWYFQCSTSNILLAIASSNANFVINNDFSGPTNNALSIVAGSQNSISQNTMGQNLGNGISMGATATQNLITGNVISGASGTFAGGIIETATSATTNRYIGNYVNGAGWYGILISSSHGNVQNNTIIGAGQKTSVYGITVSANTNNFMISNNVIIPSVGMTGPVQVTAGTSDFYNITNNLVEAGVVLDGGSGTHKTITGNN